MGMEIKVLGTGCWNCKRLYAEAEKAICRSGIRGTLTKVEAIEEITAYKIRATPALVIDGMVRSAGRVPDAGDCRLDHKCHRQGTARAVNELERRNPSHSR